jgi:hypothetical protein
MTDKLSADKFGFFPHVSGSAFHSRGLRAEVIRPMSFFSSERISQPTRKEGEREGAKGDADKCLNGTHFDARQSEVRVAVFSLATAWKWSLATADPDWLSYIIGRNADRLKRVAKLVWCLCRKRFRVVFFLGSRALGVLMGVAQQVALRLLHGLQRRGLIERLKTGRRYRNSRGEWVHEATKYLFVGPPSGGPCR